MLKLWPLLSLKMPSEETELWLRAVSPHCPVSWVLGKCVCACTRTCIHVCDKDMCAVLQVCRKCVWSLGMVFLPRAPWRWCYRPVPPCAALRDEQSGRSGGKAISSLSERCGGFWVGTQGRGISRLVSGSPWGWWVSPSHRFQIAHYIFIAADSGQVSREWVASGRETKLCCKISNKSQPPALSSCRILCRDSSVLYILALGMSLW